MQKKENKKGVSALKTKAESVTSSSKPIRGEGKGKWLNLSVASDERGVVLK